MNDKTTRRALSENGTGPTSCTDLESIGYELKGFFLVRSHLETIKTIFCEFINIEERKKVKVSQEKAGDQLKIQNLNQNHTIISSLITIPMKIEDRTSSKQSTFLNDITLLTAISTLKLQTKVDISYKKQGRVNFKFNLYIKKSIKLIKANIFQIGSVIGSSQTQKPNEDNGKSFC